MALFTNPSVKHYTLAGAVLGLIIGIAARALLPSMNLQEVALHIRVRTLLGHPSTYYSNLALLLLTVLYQILYCLLGGFLGYVLFRLVHRRHGFSVLLTQKFKVLLGIFSFVFLFFFLKVDLINPYQNSLVLPSFTASIPQDLKNKLSYIFLPSLMQPGNVYRPYTDSTLQSSNETSQGTPQSGPQHAAQSTGMQQLSQQPSQQQAPVPPPPVQTKTLSSQEIFSALNAYRQRNGRSAVQWDGALAGYAGERAAFFTRSGGTDQNKGFWDYVYNNGGNFKLGFHAISELSGYNTGMASDTVITNYFAVYPATNTQLLNTSWKFGGVGTDGMSVDIIFAGERCTSDYCNSIRSM